MNSNLPFHDIDLNTPFLEEDKDFNLDAEKHDSPLIQNNTQEQDRIISNANNEVPPAPAPPVVASTNLVAAASASVVGPQVQPMIFIDSLRVVANQGIPPGPGRRRNYRGGRACLADPLNFCTNFHCRTRITPMWRTGPLGPQTLCNACGIYYNKHVVRKGIPIVIVRADDASGPPAQGDF